VRTPIAVGLVCGDSPDGAKLAWAFDELPQAELRWICDERLRLPRTGGATSARWTAQFEDLLRDEELDAVVFASSSLAAGGRTLTALGSDKHVLIQGPLAATAAEADALVATAVARNRRLMATSPAQLRAGAQRLHRLLLRGTLGELYYVHASRYAPAGDSRLDLLRDVGTELVAIVLDLLGDEPVEVLARGDSYLVRGTPDVVFAELRFATGITAHLHLSCLEGETVDRVTVVGGTSTALLDSSGARQDLSIHTRAPAPTSLEGLETGSTIRVWLPEDEPTRTGCAEFLAAVLASSELYSGRDAAAVIAVVEALGVSCANGGSATVVSPPPAAVEPNVIALHRS
jgi:predicted dehydrogenase